MVYGFDVWEEAGLLLHDERRSFDSKIFEGTNNNQRNLARYRYSIYLFANRVEIGFGDSARTSVHVFQVNIWLQNCRYFG